MLASIRRLMRRGKKEVVEDGEELRRLTSYQRKALRLNKAIRKNHGEEGMVAHSVVRPLMRGSGFDVLSLEVRHHF